MEKLNQITLFLGLTKQKLAVRLVSMFFLTGTFAVWQSDIPYTADEYILSINVPFYILIYISAVILFSLAAYKVKQMKVDKTTLLISFFAFACTVLLRTEDVYLYTVMCVLALAVCIYSFSGDGILLIKDNKYITLGVYLGLAAAFTVFVGGLTALRYKLYVAPCFDFGIFAQMFEYMKETGIPYTTCERDTLLSHLAVHQSYIYYLLLPIYLLFPSPYTLNISQAVILASGLIPLYLICKKHGLSNTVTLAVGIVYTFYPALCSGCFYDIHENCFLTPLILWLFYFIDRDIFSGTLIMSALVCLVKEDAPMYILFIAIYMFFAKKKIVKPLILTVGALVYFFAAVWYLNNHGDGAMLYRYANYSLTGGSVQEVIKTCLVNPGFVFKQCLDADKFTFLLQMFLPLGFLPFISSKIYNYILLGPFMLINLMSNYPYQHTIDFQYNFGVTAILFYLTIVNLAALKTDKIKIITGLCVLTSVFGMVTFNSGKLTYLKYYTPENTVYSQIDEALETIPEDASVSSTTFILPHLYKHKILYQISADSPEISDRTEYIVTDLRFEDSKLIYNFYQEHGYIDILYVDGAVAIMLNPNYKAPAE